MADSQEQEDTNSNPVLCNQKSGRFSPVLGENKMSVHLTIAEDEEIIGVDIEDQTKDHSNINTNERVCQVCDKVFSSGKALGGHMRIHASNGENSNNHPAKKKSPKFHQNPRDIDFGKTKQYYRKSNISTNCDAYCSKCQRGFPSMKALYGHMRTHDKVIDLAKSLIGWPRVTARRGRRALSDNLPEAEEEVSTSDQVCVSEENDPLEKLAVDLMMLSNGNSTFGLSHSSTADIDNSEDIKYSDSKSNKRNIDKIDQPPSDDDHAENTVLEPVNKSDGGYKLDTENTDEPAEIQSPDHNNNNSNQKMRKRRKLSDLEIAEKALSTPDSAEVQESSDDKFICKTCGRIFLSHQALGGHKASHNKFKLVINDSKNSGKFSGIPARPRVRRKLIKNVVEVPKKENYYNCTSCNMSFETSKDLESHKMSSHGREFDLNEFPPQSEDI